MISTLTDCFFVFGEILFCWVSLFDVSDLAFPRTERKSRVDQVVSITKAVWLAGRGVGVYFRGYEEVECFGKASWLEWDSFWRSGFWGNYSQHKILEKPQVSERIAEEHLELGGPSVGLGVFLPFLGWVPTIVLNFLIHLRWYDKSNSRLLYNGWLGPSSFGDVVWLPLSHLNVLSSVVWFHSGNSHGFGFGHFS